MFGGHLLTLPFAFADEGGLFFPIDREDVDLHFGIPGAPDFIGDEGEFLIVPQLDDMVPCPGFVDLLANVGIEA